jgi:hypothetical protein
MVATLVGGIVGVGGTSGPLVVAGGGIAFVACWGHPRRALVLWMLSLTMIPVWVSAHLFANVPLHCIVAAMAVAATITGSRGQIPITKFEAYFALVLAASLLATLFGGSTAAVWAQEPIRWGIPFLAARILVSATGIRYATNVIAVVFAVVGCLATIELVLAWHPFVNWRFDTLEYEYWHAVQTRGGRDRSAWAFGHSIALGGSLALSIPFIARSTFDGPLKVVMFASVGAGIFATASRSSVVAAGLAAAICFIYISTSRFVRTVGITATVLVAFLATTNYLPLFQGWVRGTSREERQSADYRSMLYSTYLPEIRLFGRAPIEIRVNSIDSAVLHFGLEFGWIVLLAMLLPLTLCAARTVAGRASTAEIALFGQIPLFATVAFITQYESLIFVVAGIAVQAIIAERTAAQSDPAAEARIPAKERIHTRSCAPTGRHSHSAVAGQR